MTAPVAPKAMAHGLSKVLAQVLGPARFAVKVSELAAEYSRQRFPKEPITQVQGEDLGGFEGMLRRHPSGTKWLLLYNSGTRSAGRQRFTITHELGHYLLHRQQQAQFSCTSEDIAAAPTGGIRWRPRRIPLPRPC